MKKNVKEGKCEGRRALDLEDRKGALLKNVSDSGRR